MRYKSCLLRYFFESHIFMSSHTYKINFVFLLLMCLMSIELLDQSKNLKRRKRKVVLLYTTPDFVSANTITSALFYPVETIH